MFEGRIDGAKRLAALIAEGSPEVDLVLAIPRGGLPVGRVVADALEVPLDVVVAKKLGAPTNPEFAIGAVASDGSRWLNEDAIARLGIDDERLERQLEETRAAVEAKAVAYRGDRPHPHLEGKSVLVVDDGIATGATAISCVRLIRGAGARRIVVAVPVAPSDAIELVRAEADDVICVTVPRHFGAVCRHYRSFDQVSDEEARTYLADTPE